MGGGGGGGGVFKIGIGERKIGGEIDVMFGAICVSDFMLCTSLANSSASKLSALLGLVSSLFSSVWVVLLRRIGFCVSVWHGLELFSCVTDHWMDR